MDDNALPRIWSHLARQAHLLATACERQGAHRAADCAEAWADELDAVRERLFSGPGVGAPVPPAPPPR